MKSIFRRVPDDEEEKGGPQVSRQKYERAVGDTSLEHLYVDVASIAEPYKWAEATSLNNAILDSTRVKCYICGGSGHFIEVCPMYAALDDRFSLHGLRKSLWGRAIKNMIEK